MTAFVRVVLMKSRGATVVLSAAGAINGAILVSCKVFRASSQITEHSVLRARRSSSNSFVLCYTGTGIDCSTIVRQEQPCNEDPCPVDCSVSEWGDWSTCSEVCGGGTKYRAREIIAEAANDGLDCPPTYETSDCSNVVCSVNCAVSDWSEWSTCLH